MILAGTGHRLGDKMGGYKTPNPIYNYVCSEIERILLEQKPEKVISGLAIGYDTWLAQIALKLKIPLICAVPFIGQEKIWPKESQDTYKDILSKASETIIVSAGGYSASKLHRRNEYMVDHCDKLLACFDGVKSGGTYNCIKYATSKNKETIYINPNNHGLNNIA